MAGKSKTESLGGENNDDLGRIEQLQQTIDKDERDCISLELRIAKIERQHDEEEQQMNALRADGKYTKAKEHYDTMTGLTKKHNELAEEFNAKSKERDNAIEKKRELYERIGQEIPDLAEAYKDWKNEYIVIVKPCNGGYQVGEINRGERDTSELPETPPRDGVIVHSHGDGWVVPSTADITNSCRYACPTVIIGHVRENTYDLSTYTPPAFDVKQSPDQRATNGNTIGDLINSEYDPQKKSTMLGGTNAAEDGLVECLQKQAKLRKISAAPDFGSLKIERVRRVGRR